MPCVGGRDGEGGREIYKRTNKCEAKLLQPLHRPVRNVREEGKKPAEGNGFDCLETFYFVELACCRFFFPFTYATGCFVEPW